MRALQLGQPQPTSRPNQFRIDFPRSIGDGGVDLISFASGPNLIVLKSQSNQQAPIQYTMTESFVGFGFCLAGQFECSADFFKTSQVIKKGESGYFSFPGPLDFVERFDSPSLCRVCLMLRGDEVFTLAEGEEDRFAPILKSLERKSFRRESSPLTPTMKAILYQILNCPYQGVTRQLFLEGKAMELLANKVEQLYPGGSHNRGTNSTEDERVRYAAHMLIQDLENPPDIKTLAKSSGLSRTKLFRCFRQTFGLSPHEFLRNQRMLTAMQLLQNGEGNVTETAFMVGMNNLSYFAKTFKSMFGLAPGDLRKQALVSSPG